MICFWGLVCGLTGSLNASWLSDRLGINIDLAKTPGKIDEPVNNAIVNQSPASLPVSPTERAFLIDKLMAYHATTANVSNFYSRASLVIVLGSILLGLSASIAAFGKASKTAGVLSIIATGVLGIGNALPINQNADFYRLLSAQSNALASDAALRPTMNVGEYAAFRDGLKTLMVFEGERFPGRTGTQQATQDLITQLAGVSSRFASAGTRALSPVQQP